eukprot:CAMPEP_0174377026 /NCGR_PEP_ID=MMETSP0811_2-20130205/120530_1 /TAXON_ID=73025 ORGANISM="Eutreptiella gymnastica-like, Strain CCMP1594" /NCGR_SAMPLE_ID=MMETSP0811_2 /ASSEMBLY_ACC=CAM_ASM_000667 /LENGTH=77 /DNA_ID=CAMNT_0015528855 /DNA_START=167 /DNA_END=397 /DNA_ORIENTATION=-
MHNNTSGLSFLSEIDGRKTETRLTEIPGNLVLFQGLGWQRDAVHCLIFASSKRCGHVHLLGMAADPGVPMLRGSDTN